jgi:predicted aspartyl protease
MVALTLFHGLPFVDVRLEANNQELILSNVLVDTGAESCVFKSDDLELIGVEVENTDMIRFITGVGGREAVIEKQIDRITVGDLTFGPIVIEMGRLNYGFPLNGILGMDFLVQTGAIVDLQRLELYAR